jgi:hypothetical protein
MVAPPIMSGPPPQVSFYSPASLPGKSSTAKSTTSAKRYVPVEDGFVTTAGNKELGAKYGNPTGSNTISIADVRQAEI